MHRPRTLGVIATALLICAGAHAQHTVSTFAPVGSGMTCEIEPSPVPLGSPATFVIGNIPLSFEFKTLFVCFGFSAPGPVVNLPIGCDFPPPQVPFALAGSQLVCASATLPPGVTEIRLGPFDLPRFDIYKQAFFLCNGAPPCVLAHTDGIKLTFGG